MSPYLGLDIGVFAVGLAVLGAVAWRLWGQVKRLGRSVNSAAGRIADAQAELDRIAAKRSRPEGRDVDSKWPVPSEGARRG